MKMAGLAGSVVRLTAAESLKVAGMAWPAATAHRAPCPFLNTHFKILH